jgi:hypothetical protein
MGEWEHLEWTKFFVGAYVEDVGCFFFFDAR